MSGESGERSEPWPRGCVQVYTGDGKGKTTAAFGMALRAAGRGMRVWIGQLMKGFPYGELAGAGMLGGLLTVEQHGSPECIPWREEPRAEDVERARKGLDACKRALSSGNYRIVVLDEACVALGFALIEERDLLELIDLRPPEVELVLTGRGAPRAVIERADLVTEMRELKHPYATQGLEARDGIER
ncbi:MAG: cob(I)yrinic acid a,c-diamide adenosyltransferase [Polyangia bacterium]